MCACPKIEAIMSWMLGTSGSEEVESATSQNLASTTLGGDCVQEHPDECPHPS
jgi:hypothetical protein